MATRSLHAQSNRRHAIIAKPYTHSFILLSCCLRFELRSGLSYRRSTNKLKALTILWILMESNVSNCLELNDQKKIQLFFKYIHLPHSQLRQFCCLSCVVSAQITNAVRQKDVSTHKQVFTDCSWNTAIQLQSKIVTQSAQPPEARGLI